MKFIKIVNGKKLGRWGEKRVIEGENMMESTLYGCMEMSQKTFLQLRDRERERARTD
jgi:hypothetical protein